MSESAAPATTSILIISDFNCPWCYVGMSEIAKLQQEYEFDIEWAPYLLDPSIPPEGRLREPYSKPGDPPSPIEERAENLGIRITRGRTFYPNSHLALEAAEFAGEHGKSWEFHLEMFRVYFEEMANIGELDVIVGVGESVGLDASALREALETRRYRDLVDEGVEWSRALGVTGVPTFVINEQYGVVGAQEYPVLLSVMEQLGVPKKAASA